MFRGNSSDCRNIGNCTFCYQKSGYWIRREHIEVIANNNNIKLEAGRTHNLVAGVHIGGCGDVLYLLSNMECVSVNEEGYSLQGKPNTVGLLRGPVFVYKDEVFAVFDTDLFKCLVYC